MTGSIKGDCVAQFPSDEPGPPGLETNRGERSPYDLRPSGKATAVLPPSPSSTKWPPSVSRDEPEKLSAETKVHSFFVRTERPELLSTIGVLELIAKCPDAGDGQGVTLHRDVLFSLGYHLLDKVHELEAARKGQRDEGPRYDEKLSRALDQLGDKDAELKELRAALGEATVKIRRLEAKIFK